MHGWVRCIGSRAVSGKHSGSLRKPVLMSASRSPQFPGRCSVARIMHCLAQLRQAARRPAPAPPSVAARRSTCCQCSDLHRSSLKRCSSRPTPRRRQTAEARAWRSGDGWPPAVKDQRSCRCAGPPPHGPPGSARRRPQALTRRQ